MKVYGKCKSCAVENEYSTNANTRVEFAMQDGETIQLNCKNCGNNKVYEVDELYAKPSKIAQLIAGLIFLVGTPLIFIGINSIFAENRNHYVVYIIGGFITVPIMVYTIINRQDQNRVGSFNKRKLKGRIHNIT